MLPLIAYNLLQSISLITSAATLFARNCIDGVSANVERCASTIEQSLALATYLVPLIGYDRAAEIAKEAHRTGKTVREVALSKKALPAEEIEKALSRIYSQGENT
jgi:fumarate hydratase class II